MSLAIKVDVASDPIDIRWLGADAVMFVAANVPDLVEQFRLAGAGTGSYGAVHEVVAGQTRRPSASRIRRPLVVFFCDCRSSNLR